METLTTIPDTGWIVIGFIAVLLFIVMMKRGLKIGSGKKSIFVGKAMDKRLEDFKKEIEKQNLLRSRDEELRKTLFKKSLKIDEHLMADMRRSVRRVDTAVAKLFEPFLLSALPIALLSALIKDKLHERLDYNNVKEKLATKEIGFYIADIIRDLRDKYSTFYLQANQLNNGERYPEWAEIEAPLTKLIEQWAHEIVCVLCEHITEKIEVYHNEAENFNTVEYKNNAINYPIKKNKNYLKALGAKKWNY